MDCQDVEQFLDAYVDQELDLVHDLAVAQHLQQCQSCSQRYEALLALQTLVRTHGTYYVPPAAFPQRLAAAWRRRAAGPFGRVSWRIMAAAAVLAVVLGGTFWPWPFASRVAVDQVGREIVAAHVRSLQVDHLTDIVSSDTHTLKPWFSDKLPFAPSVRNLETHGFPLVGARLDYLDERPVAALVYRRRQHFINVFLAPGTVDTTLPPFSVIYRGYHLFRWHHHDLSWWAVSDLNPGELGLLVQLLQAQN